MKKQIGSGTVLLLTYCFCCVFLLSNIYMLYTAEKALGGQSQKTTTGGDKPTLDIKPSPKIRRELTKPPRPRLDLKCWIRAFYDEARTKPLTEGVYHFATAPEPKRIYFDHIVKNIGSPDTASEFSVLLQCNFPGTVPYAKTIRNLGPGESHVIQDSLRVSPRSLSHGRRYNIRTVVDNTGLVREDVETNNECIYRVMFRR